MNNGTESTGTDSLHDQYEKTSGEWEPPSYVAGLLKIGIMAMIFGTFLYALISLL